HEHHLEDPKPERLGRPGGGRGLGVAHGAPPVQGRLLVLIIRLGVVVGNERCGGAALISIKGCSGANLMAMTGV
ncbi:MAG: hypothetical protein L0K41_10750, partial [Yaniella sp.]|nr:hypothetical protein [Yaniella sp.]